MTGFHERAKMRENISHGCKAMRDKAPGRVACLEFAEGEKRTAITTDRAVEEPSSTAFLCRYRKATPYNSSLQLLELCGDV